MVSLGPIAGVSVALCTFFSGGVLVWNSMDDHKDLTMFGVTVKKAKTPYVYTLPHIIGEKISESLDDGLDFLSDLLDTPAGMAVIVLGTIVLLAAIVGFGFLCCRRKHSRQSWTNEPGSGPRLLTRAHTLRDIPRDLIESALCPIKGLIYLLTHLHILKMMAYPFLISLVCTIVSLIVFFGKAFEPQELYLQEQMGWPSWVAWTVSAIAVVAEVSVLNLLAFIVLCKPVQNKIYRTVLAEQGVVEKLQDQGLDDISEPILWIAICHASLFLLARVVLMLLTLPLNAYPVAGQIMWVVSNGWLYTWALQTRFIRVLEEPEFRFVLSHFVQFVTFGAVAIGLELLPFLGPWILFASNACGAALLAEKIADDIKFQPREKSE